MNGPGSSLLMSRVGNVRSAASCWVLMLLYAFLVLIRLGILRHTTSEPHTQWQQQKVTEGPLMERAAALYGALLHGTGRWQLVSSPLRLSLSVWLTHLPPSSLPRRGHSLTTSLPPPSQGAFTHHLPPSSRPPSQGAFTHHHHLPSSLPRRAFTWDLQRT